MPSVADLVEPEVLLARAGEYLQRAGEVLLAAGGVHVMHFTPSRVTAEVDDAGDRHEVELAATGDRLAIHCDCPMGGHGEFCPHSVATAIETWQRAPERRA